MSGRPASSAGWYSPSQRVAWGDAVRTELERDPAQTIAELQCRTHAPPHFIRDVRARYLRRLASAS